MRVRSRLVVVSVVLVFVVVLAFVVLVITPSTTLLAGSSQEFTDCVLDLTTIRPSFEFDVERSRCRGCERNPGELSSANAQQPRPPLAHRRERQIEMSESI